jgi:hypothetical protein
MGWPCTSAEALSAAAKIKSDPYFPAQPPGAGSDSYDAIPGFGCLMDSLDGRDRNAAILADEFKKNKLATLIKDPVQVSEKSENSKKNDASKTSASLLNAREHLAEGNAYFSPAKSQGRYNSCTAHVVTSMLEYHYRKARLSAGDVSRLFLYKATRRLIRTSGDTGASLRAAMKAAMKFGAPPEGEWPYEPARLLDVTPDAMTCQLASLQRLHGYYRLDDGTASKEALVTRVKAALSLKLPVTCGVPIHQSAMTCGEDNGYVIPEPGDNAEKNDPVIGGHALLIVGYDNDAPADDAPATKKGSFIVLNSWGPDWGDYGYAFLPYAFLEKGLALDLWVGLIPQFLPPET